MWAFSSAHVDAAQHAKPAKLCIDAGDVHIKRVRKVKHHGFDG
jgi:hypothetical protein